MALPGEAKPYALHAEFYRFLDRNGALIPPGPTTQAGALSPEAEKQLRLPQAPFQPQLGYLSQPRADGAPSVLEVIAMPIFSTETGEAVAALVLGFKPVEFDRAGPGPAIKRGLWQAGRLFLPQLPVADQPALEKSVAEAIAGSGRGEGGFTGSFGGGPHQVFFKELNPGSQYPATYEVTLYPLDELRAGQAQLRWRIIGLGGLLLLGGLGASRTLAGWLTVPVQRLAVDSAENLAQRERAEAALETTGEELQRAARFSADASHQLKTPLAVLRAGLEELQARGGLDAEAQQEISTLMHQTYRLSSVIDDLLLLSRMDAGQLKLNFGRVCLSQLIEASLDDLGALPNAADITIEKDFPAELAILGDRHYTGLILQNLLENARKYNRPGGRIHVGVRQQDEQVFLLIGNTGAAIPLPAQAHIFERFHRGAMGENVPGYGLGLNLARQLARIHGGDLRLVGSAADWTEFEVRFCAAASPVEKGGSQ
jgi:signal transduction histidine kinase